MRLDSECIRWLWQSQLELGPNFVGGKCWHFGSPFHRRVGLPHLDAIRSDSIDDWTTGQSHS